MYLFLNEDNPCQTSDQRNKVRAEEERDVVQSLNDVQLYFLKQFKKIHYNLQQNRYKFLT